MFASVAPSVASAAFTVIVPWPGKTIVMFSPGSSFMKDSFLVVNSSTQELLPVASWIGISVVLRDPAIDTVALPGHFPVNCIFTVM